MVFNTTTAEFTAEFNYSDLATGDSVAYLNQEYWYNGEPSVTIAVAGSEVDTSALGYACSNNYCSFDMSKHAGIMSGDKVTITATAAI